MYIYIYIYVRIYVYTCFPYLAYAKRILVADKWGRLYNGAAAKVIIFDRLGKRVRPGTFGNIKVGKWENTSNENDIACAMSCDVHNFRD